MKLQWPEGLNVENFLSEYWQKKPLLFRAAFPNFENPLSPDELGGLALDDEINSRLILRESDTSWHLRHGPFREEELTSLPATDWTLLVSEVETHLEGFNQFLAFFRFIPDWRIDDLMISYAPTGASAGAHVDAYDVFLFQAAGTRRWMIDSNIDAEPAFLPDNDIKILKSFTPDDDWLLEPGDMLYLPPGVAHHGISQDDNCMTWSVGFRAPSHSEFLLDLTQQISRNLNDEPRYQDPAQQLQKNSGEINEETISAFRRIWEELTSLDDKTFQQLLGQVLTRRNLDAEPSAAEGENTALELSDLATGDVELLARNPAARFAFSRENRNTTLFVNGESFKVTKSFAIYLTENLQYDAAELLEQAKGKDNGGCLQALLHTPGIFQYEEEEDGG